MGCCIAAYYFIEKFVKDLKSYGFELNPYDPCVANKMVDGKQLTICWHVDDLKASHEDSKVIDDFIQWIKDKYEDEEITKVRVTRGKKHDYLGMNLDYSKPGKVIIEMKDYVRKMIEEFSHMKEIVTKIQTPTAKHLFITRDNCPKLSKEKAEVFHTWAAKGLFLCQRYSNSNCIFMHQS